MSTWMLAFSLSAQREMYFRQENNYKKINNIHINILYSFLYVNMMHGMLSC